MGTETIPANRGREYLDRVVIRFAGDSGDGMQLTGDRFTEVSAAFGNDLATMPDYPAEIRAPAGTVAGVSAFQVHISDHDISTPGDSPNVLVAMNPAALKASIRDLFPGATIIVNIDAFETRNLEKAGYAANPLEDGSLDAFTVYEVPMTSMTLEAAKETGAKPRDAERSKNFFALGVVSWMYSRPIEPVIDWIDEAVRQQGDRPRRQPGRVQGRVQLRRDGRAVPARLRDRPRRPPQGPVPQHHRQHRPGLRPARRQPPVGPRPLPRLVPDHAGLRHPPRAVEAQVVRCPHHAGGGRDRRHRRRPRRLLRRPARRHHHQRPRASTSSRRPSAWP